VFSFLVLGQGFERALRVLGKSAGLTLVELMIAASMMGFIATGIAASLVLISKEQLKATNDAAYYTFLTQFMNRLEDEIACTQFVYRNFSPNSNLSRLNSLNINATTIYTPSGNVMVYSSQPIATRSDQPSSTQVQPYYYDTTAQDPYCTRLFADDPSDACPNIVPNRQLAGSGLDLCGASLTMLSTRQTLNNSSGTPSENLESEVMVALKFQASGVVLQSSDDAAPRKCPTYDPNGVNVPSLNGYTIASYSPTSMMTVSSGIPLRLRYLGDNFYSCTRVSRGNAYIRQASTTGGFWNNQVNPNYSDPASSSGWLAQTTLQSTAGPTPQVMVLNSLNGSVSYPLVSNLVQTCSNISGISGTFYLMDVFGGYLGFTCNSGYASLVSYTPASGFVPCTNWASHDKANSTAHSCDLLDGCTQYTYASVPNPFSAPVGCICQTEQVFAEKIMSPWHPMNSCIGTASDIMNSSLGGYVYGGTPAHPDAFRSFLNQDNKEDLVVAFYPNSSINFQSVFREWLASDVVANSDQSTSQMVSGILEAECVLKCNVADWNTAANSEKYYSPGNNSVTEYPSHCEPQANQYCVVANKADYTNLPDANGNPPLVPYCCNTTLSTHYYKYSDCVTLPSDCLTVTCKVFPLKVDDNKLFPSEVFNKNCSNPISTCTEFNAWKSKNCGPTGQCTSGLPDC
jgi:type II secretory pathway pseudopilin PulG